MPLLEIIKKQLADKINDCLGLEAVQPSDLLYPPEASLGDLSLPCFVAAKQSGANPAQVAEKLVGLLSDYLKQPESMVASISSAGPYLNFRLKIDALGQGIMADIENEGAEYGANRMGEGQRVMLEFSNVNTHKEFHVGHLRNLCYGDAVTRIMRHNGFEAMPVSYINDFGIHVAKTLWAYLEYYRSTELPANKGEFLGKVYVRASQEIKADEHKKALANFMMKKIESRTGEEYELWQKTREWSIEQHQSIYRDMGVIFEKTYYESEMIEKGKTMIDDLLEKGILKMSQGAVIADLEEYDLGVLVFLRSDGTATYPVADLPLAVQKFEENKLDASIYVVDIRQELYFKQLFKIMKLIGYKKPMIHLGYDFVKLPDGMMSSRSGNVITYEELRGVLAEKIRQETAKRHPDWNGERVEGVVAALVKATIKFEMLKVGAKQTIIFDLEKALSFQGFTAAYLLYTCARINSVIEKSGRTPEDLSQAAVSLSHDKERLLLMKLAKYPDALKAAGQNFDPSLLAKYAFELAQNFNDYYHEVKIIGSEAEKERLRLLSAVSQVLQNGLSTLGIEALREM